MPLKSLFLIFNAIGLSHINYSSIIISTSSHKLFSKINSAYSSAGCILHNCTKSALHDTDWQKLDEKLILARYLFLHKILYHNFAPPLKSCFIENKCRYNLRKKNAFSISRLKKSKTSQSFSIWAPRLWNKLPQNVKSIPNISSFLTACTAWITHSLEDN